jgi:PAS domain-containing protein
MKSICAWCGSEIAPGGTEEPADGPVSHGICASCRNNIDCQEGVALQSYLDSIPLPILVLDSKFQIAALNSKACEITGSNPKDSSKRLPGDVFECEQARLPEGCGRAVCCSGCAIRKAVLKTFETGEPESGIPATLTLEGDHAAVALTITAIKAGDVVMLRIEGLGD